MSDVESWDLIDIHQWRQRNLEPTVQEIGLQFYLRNSNFSQN